MESGDATLHCVVEGDAIHLFWRGHAYVLRREGPATAAAATDSAGSLEAPMPGRVVEVKVAPGDVVVPGQALLILEAMKMENVVRAPRAGRVAAVAVAVGAQVAPGQVLVELE
jgi:biotin carboxyl carrier protein